MAGVFVNQLLHKNTQRNRKPRIFRERRNPHEFLSDAELVERYRLPRAGIEQIIKEIKDDISQLCARNHSIDPYMYHKGEYVYCKKINFN